jgi:hypothetical protein
MVIHNRLKGILWLKHNKFVLRSHFFLVKDCPYQRDPNVTQVDGKERIEDNKKALKSALITHPHTS